MTSRTGTRVGSQPPTDVLILGSGLAGTVLAAALANGEHFKPVENLEQGLLDINENLMANAYASFRDFLGPRLAIPLEAVRWKPLNFLRGLTALPVVVSSDGGQ
jgi:choline dehydrogenase-like flavoprotein